jgi:hypothetical protein
MQLTEPPQPSEGVMPHWPLQGLAFGVQQVELLQTWPAAQPQVTEPPQLSGAVMPHLPPQGLGLGVQQFVALQTWPEGQLFAGQEIIPLQLSEMLVLHRLPHVARLQHVKAGIKQRWPAAHAPQLTLWLQLLVAEPHCFVPHASCVVSATHAPHVLFVHTRPPAHVPQSIGLPQLSFVIPQRPVHQFANLVHRHWLFTGLQPQPVGQLFGQFHWTPHESVPGLQRFWQKVSFGVHASNASIPVSRASSRASLRSASVCPSESSPSAFDASLGRVWSSPSPTTVLSDSDAVTSASSEAALSLVIASLCDASVAGIPSSMPRRLAHPSAAAAPHTKIARAARHEAKWLFRPIPSFVSSRKGAGRRFSPRQTASRNLSHMSIREGALFYLCIKNTVSVHL